MPSSLNKDFIIIIIIKVSKCGPRACCSSKLLQKKNTQMKTILAAYFCIKVFLCFLEHIWICGGDCARKMTLEYDKRLITRAFLFIKWRTNDSKCVVLKYHYAFVYLIGGMIISTSFLNADIDRTEQNRFF